ncbi:MAG: S41 family peptidase [Bacteroidota bacterium]
MFNKKIIALILISYMGITGFVNQDSDIYFKISKSIDIFGKVYKEVTLNYVDNINPENFMISGIKGMLSSLDPYTNYIDETMKKDFDIVTTGKYGGIGTSVGLRNEKVIILELMEGYPAQRQGLRVGDVIVKVDSVELCKDNYEKLSSYLKGEPGKIIQLTIQREGIDDNLLFEIVLEEITIKNLTYYGFVPEDGNTAYLKLSGFSRSAGTEVKNALVELEKVKDIKSIIVDLRGNPGGLLDQAIDVSEKFLKRKELIVSVVGRDSHSASKYFAEEEPLMKDQRVVALIDGGSASASEIVAGALKDHDRGVIVGTQSFGKGLVQTVLPLSFNTSLKITTAKYYTPSGRCIQKIDYTKKADIFEGENVDEEEGFYTDNMREVFANGGITPDTIISNKSESKQIQVLLARGMFFRFATNYFNTHDVTDINQLADDDLFQKFIEYIKANKFDYSSKSEKLLEDLRVIAEKEEMQEDIFNLISQLDQEYEDEKIAELEKYNQEIICLIKEELAARIDGRSGRILQSLKHDRQFEVATSILQNGNAYNNLLGITN